MSCVVDEVQLSSQAQESAYPELVPNAQLLALSEIHSPVEIPSRTRSSTIDSSSVDQESLIGKRAASVTTKSEGIDQDESPLSYKSLEERATNAAIRWERSQSHEQLSSAQFSTQYESDRRHLIHPKSSATLTESDDLSQKPAAIMKDSQKAVSPKMKQVTALRRGKWTVEEEAYVARVIQDFNSGYLDAPAGTTLRTYLSEKLKCDPMRITKKFTGDACIGKRVFHPVIRTSSNSSTIDIAQVRKYSKLPFSYERKELSLTFVFLIIFIVRPSLTRWSEGGDIDLKCSNVNLQKKRPPLPLWQPLLLLGELRVPKQTQLHKQRHG
jgi:hypothetical protein